MGIGASKAGSRHATDGCSTNTAASNRCTPPVFWVIRDGRQRVLRPHRVAWALAEGESVDLHPVVEHVVCDNPLCVRADGTPLDHLEGSTQAANLSRIAQRGRRGAMGYRSRMLGREAMYRRSLALRAAVADGWDDERIARALASVDENQLALF